MRPGLRQGGLHRARAAKLASAETNGRSPAETEPRCRFGPV